MNLDFHEFWLALTAQFWTREQPWLMASGLLLWGFLRYTLPLGSQYVLQQTLTFFVLCLMGELGAATMHGLGWTMVAGGFHEIFLIGVGIALIRFFGLLVFRVAIPVLHIETPRILEDITVIAGYSALVLVRMRYAGFDPSQIVATSAVITAVVAFAMQDTLGNILGGLAIHLDHSVEIGDWIVVDGVSGRVMDIRWRYTKIATRNGEKVVMPNSQLMKTRFSVVGAYSGVPGQNNAWRRWIWFNAGLEHTPTQVLDIVEQAVLGAQIVHVANDPKPSCVLMSFEAGYARYALRYWLTNPELDDPTDSVVRMHVFAAMKRAGIELAIPQEARHLIKENAAHEAALADQEMKRRVEAIGHIDLFRTLSDAEKATLAQHLVYSPFIKGDIIIRQGADTHWLYIVISGEAEVWLEAENERRQLSTLGAGSVVGEMSLLTGELRHATVIAKTDVDSYQMDRAGFEKIMHDRPAIAEELSHILAAREAELGQLRETLEKSALATRQLSRRESILRRIHAYFGINAG
ncbi:MAG: mechanosensitive ion channel family protein [Rugosibacter sp.]